MDLNDSKTVLIHKRIIKNKRYLSQFYRDCYLEIKSKIEGCRPIVELGSGGGFIKEIIEGIITSDVIPGPDIDKVFSATNIPFGNKSVGAFVMFSVLHHIKNPAIAFREMQRCLKKGGKIVMIEPYNTFLSSFIFRNFHSEKFDPEASWKVDGKGRLTDANLAMPWIIFVRDKKIFRSKFVNLKIVQIKPHSPLIYLFSGGISYPWTFPPFFYTFIKNLEKLIAHLNFLTAMWVTIELIAEPKKTVSF